MDQQMDVAELIERLKEMPPTATVKVPSRYDGDWVEVADVELGDTVIWIK